MQPLVWSPPVELSDREQAIVKRIKRAKLFVFVRQQRHVLFAPAFQQTLAAMYKDTSVGHPPIPPAQLALATILQAYTGVSDDEVIEATTMDRRWQLVLDCLAADHPPFSKATLIAFRQRLIATHTDALLLEHTVAVAAASGAFGARQLRAALDSSPLWGAGRVEDTVNLLGHALRLALRVMGRQQGRGLAETATDLGLALRQDVSLKAALDLDWADPRAATQALTQLLAALERVDAALDAQPDLLLAVPEVLVPLATAAQVQAQDVATNDAGQPVLRQGVARDRRISVEDPQMRHGRKHRSQRVDGYKRHVLRDLDRGLVVAVGVTPANVPEAQVTDSLSLDLAAQQLTLRELHIDRAYLASRWVQEREAALAIYCKAWPVRNGPRYSKVAFTLDWERGAITCPAGVQQPFALGERVQFPAAHCGACAVRERCTTSARGRSVQIHPDERLLVELRTQQETPAGRAKLRERVGVEHSLAHVGHWQGDRARYGGTRKNLFDLRRVGVVHNLHILARQPALVAPAAA